MCFSETASFLASGVLFAIGTACVIRAAQNTKYLMFSMLPLFFAIQQAAEGMLWHTLKQNQESLLYIYIFLFFAMFLWPTWIPIAIYKLEKQKRRSVFLIPIIAGLSVSTMTIIYGATSRYATASIKQCHIYYDFKLPHSILFFFGALYLLATLIPFFVSSLRSVKIMGSFFSIAYVVTFLFYRVYLISVWCFFSAILSVLVFKIIPKKN